MSLRRNLIVIKFALCLVILSFPQLVLASKTHVARKSESLYSIARKYHVSVDELKSVNNLTGSKINKGDRLIIPSNSGNQEKAAKTVEKAKTYKVARGDTLPKIARTTGVKMGELRRLNNLKGNRIKAGQVLALNETPAEIAPAPRPVVAANRLELVNKALLNEQEFSDTLAELTDIDSDRPVDLAKKLEQKTGPDPGLRQTAYSFLGARYVFGGSRRNALDCSSFTQQVFRQFNVKLPRTAREQFSVGNEVMRGDLRKGDLVFFQTYANFPSHVGIYLGNRKMIHASSRDRRVIISSMDNQYYLSRYLGARRVGVEATDETIYFDDLMLGVEEERDNDSQLNDMMGVSLLEKK